MLKTIDLLHCIIMDSSYCFFFNHSANEGVRAASTRQRLEGVRGFSKCNAIDSSRVRCECFKPRSREPRLIGSGPSI